MSDELRARIAELEAKLADAKKEKRDTLELRVSDKGGISIYGIGRFPVTLYAEQFAKIGELYATQRMQSFVANNWDKLSFRADKAGSDAASRERTMKLFGLSSGDPEPPATEAVAA